MTIMNDDVIIMIIDDFLSYRITYIYHFNIIVDRYIFQNYFRALHRRRDGQRIEAVERVAAVTIAPAADK